MEEKIKAIEKLGRDLLAKLRVSAETSVKTDGRSVLFEVELAEPGPLIGRDGQTLSDLQYLFRLMVNRRLGDFTYLTVDINSYRRRQREQVEQEVARAIELVRTTRRSQLLSPMPAASRRIVHMMVKKEKDLDTQSVGQEPSRRVIIKINQEE